MTNRIFALTLAALATLAAWPVQAQGLRAAPQSGISLVPGMARPQGPRQADFIVAVVNSEPITNNEVRARVARIAQQMAQQGSAMPSEAELGRQVLERLILEKAQLQAARETGIKVEDTAVDLAEQNVARQNQIDVPELRRRLAKDGLALSQFREELRNQLITTRLREREVDGKVKISDQEVDAYQREQQAGGAAMVQEINLGMVLVAVPENATPERVAELQAKAQGVLNRAKAGEDFATLVRQYSDGPDKNGGGVLGMRNAERYPQLFADAVRDVPVGGLSPLLRSAAGFHILKLIDKREGGVPLAVPQNHARHILLRPSAQLGEAAARDKLLDFKKRVEAGQADFATLARENSQDGSAKEGGDLGWSNPGQFVPEFEEVVEAL
ncbi:MAG: molecular chaperone SurA, partial [Rhodoferax sp.]|nr:molecular chaperone SurA [Rhodoferax sp.]